MAREQQTGGMEGLLLAPIERTAIFFGKAVGNLILMLLMEVVLLPLSAALLDAPLLKLPVVPVLVLGTTGYAVIGTLLAAIAVHTRAREVLLPILLLPLAVPLLLAAVRATEGIIAGAPFVEIAGWVRLLGAYDLIMIAIALVTFDGVVEE
jgi:heme exporter protein B